ncbi:hypothetical protein LXL04_011147 [Taraxacum kok-saghyz]
MVADIKKQFKTVVSIGQCRRARKWARDMIEGKLSEHYSKIWDYSNELLRSNPGSTCKVGLIMNPDGKNYFQRFYICFEALSTRWKKACRKVIGLDGCFLKGEVKGELLTVIGRDANNQVYPIAWAVVDVESKPNWTWFLELLHEDLSLNNGRGLVVISDQHKGILEAVKDILPNVKHRQCARHIYANFHRAYSGLEYKKLFWASSMSCVEADFKRNMAEMNRICPGGYGHLMSKQPKTWCRAYFNGGYACETVENGISECFNSIIIDARRKPLITMLEEIRIYVMDRIAHMNEKALKWKTNVCPAVLKKMKIFGKYMRYSYVCGTLMFWMVIHSQWMVFETRFQYQNLSGIPCVHAIAAINYIHKTPEAYIHPYFLKDTFLSCYETNIKPVNGSNMWEETPFLKPLPPMVRRMPGRPKTKRKKHRSEQTTKFSTSRVSVARTVRCHHCKQFGHNCNDPIFVITTLRKLEGGKMQTAIETEGGGQRERHSPLSSSSIPPVARESSGSRVAAAITRATHTGSERWTPVDPHQRPAKRIGRKRRTAMAESRRRRRSSSAVAPTAIPTHGTRTLTSARTGVMAACGYGKINHREGSRGVAVEIPHSLKILNNTGDTCITYTSEYIGVGVRGGSHAPPSCTWLTGLTSSERVWYTGSFRGRLGEMGNFVGRQSRSYDTVLKHAKNHGVTSWYQSPAVRDLNMKVVFRLTVTVYNGTSAMLVKRRAELCNRYQPWIRNLNNDAKEGINYLEILRTEFLEGVDNYDDPTFTHSLTLAFRLSKNEERRGDMIWEVEDDMRARYPQLFRKLEGGKIQTAIETEGGGQRERHSPLSSSSIPPVARESSGSRVAAAITRATHTGSERWTPADPHQRPAKRIGRKRRTAMAESRRRRRSSSAAAPTAIPTHGTRTLTSARTGVMAACGYGQINHREGSRGVAVEIPHSLKILNDTGSFRGRLGEMGNFVGRQSRSYDTVLKHNEAVPTEVPPPKKMGRPKKCPTEEEDGAPAEENGAPAKDNGAPAQEENEAPSQEQSQPSGSTLRRTKMKAKRPRDTTKKQKLAARRGGGSSSRGRILIDEVMNDGDEPEGEVQDVVEPVGEVNEGVDIVQKLVRELIDDLDVYEPLDVHQVFGNYEAGNVDDVFMNAEHVNVADEPVNVADEPVYVADDPVFVNVNAQPVNVSDVHQGGPTARVLREALNDVEDGISEILADIDEDDTETVIEPDFSEGDDGGVIPDKHQLNEEDVAVLLEAGYTMAELEGNPQLQMPVDDTAPVVMDLADDSQPVYEDGEVVIADDGAAYVFADEMIVGAGEEGNEADDEGVNNLPRIRRRRPSERILKKKLKKAVYDKDGGGSSAAKPVHLD